MPYFFEIERNENKMPVLVMLIVLGLLLFILFAVRYAEGIGNIFFKIFIKPLTSNCEEKVDKTEIHEEKENIQE